MKCGWKRCPNELTKDQVRRGCHFCSRSCGNKRECKYPPRRCRFCPRWLTQQQLYKGNITCGYECGGMMQRTLPAERRHARAMKGNAARAEKVRQRLLTAIVEDIKPALETFDPELRKALAVATVKVILKHRREAYARGYSARYARTQRGWERREEVPA